MSTALAWFDCQTAEAPAALSVRARSFLSLVEEDSPISEQLAAAGLLALDAAVAAGNGREAAIDLLAGDALITLALLECGTRDPGNLLQDATALRRSAMPVGGR